MVTDGWLIPMCRRAHILWFTLTLVLIRPWTTWSGVHSDWVRIDIFRAALLSPFVAPSYYISWWPVSGSTFLFVAFFSFGKDVMDEYRKCFLWLRARIPRQSNNSFKSKGSFFVMRSSTLVIFLSRCVRALYWSSLLYRSKATHELPISNPKSLSYSETTESALPPYPSQKNHDSLSDYDTHSEVTTHYSSPPFGECKAIGSYTDITLCSPTTITSFSTRSHEIPDAEPTHSWLHRLFPFTTASVDTSPPTRNSPRHLSSDCNIHPF